MVSKVKVIEKQQKLELIGSLVKRVELDERKACPVRYSRRRVLESWTETSDSKVYRKCFIFASQSKGAGPGKMDLVVIKVNPDADSYVLEEMQVNKTMRAMIEIMARRFK